MSCRLLLDEHLPLIARSLRDRGHDAVTVQELRVRGQPDLVILEMAASQQRIIVTSDVADFLMLDEEWQAEGKEHSGIILLAQRTWDFEPGRIVRRLEGYLEQMDYEIPGIVIWLPHLTP